MGIHCFLEDIDLDKQARTALVTGGGSGIGHAATLALLACGFNVAMAGIEPDPVEAVPAVTATHGVTAAYYPFDLSDIDTHADLVSRVEADLGPIHCLVNNAGVSSMVRGDLLELKADSFDRSLAVNLRGTFFLTQLVARRMLAHGEESDGGIRSIINIGSVNAEIVGENRGDYCITKAGVAMMTKLFATRLAEAGVAVFEIRPGIIKTRMTSPSSERYSRFIAEGGVPQKRWGMPEDIAAVVATWREAMCLSRREFIWISAAACRCTGSERDATRKSGKRSRRPFGLRPAGSHACRRDCDPNLCQCRVPAAHQPASIP